MMIVMHPTYTLRVVVKDRYPERGAKKTEELTSEDFELPKRRFYSAFGETTGCDEVLKVIREALDTAGLVDCKVTLEKFDHAS